MKKTISRIIPFAIAVVMLCVMTTVAFAEVYRGTFRILDGRNIYEGRYLATLYVYSTRASASLEISDYEGPLTITAAELSGTVYIIASGITFELAELKGADSTYVSKSVEYSASGYEDIFAVCEYKFLGNLLTTETVYAD